MIEKMKKLSLLLYHAQKESFLDQLRELGVVHVVENPAVESPRLSALRDMARRYGRVSADLRRIASENKVVTVPASKTADEIATEYEQLKGLRDSAQVSISALTKERNIAAPWGAFDPQTVELLRSAGVAVHLVRIPEKKFALASLNQYPHEVIAREAGVVYCAIVYKAADTLPPIEGAEMVALPTRAVQEVEKAIALQQVQVQEAQKGIVALSAQESVVRIAAGLAGSDATGESVQLSLDSAADGKVVSLTGWVPVKRSEELGKFLDKFSAWFALEDPSPQDNVPVQLINGPLTRLFEPITKIFALPNYFELDPTPFFAPFYALFFGLCLGDIGYGLCLLLIGLVFAFKGPKALRGIFALVAVLGVMTILAGVALNSLFGQAFVKGVGPVGPALLNPAGRYYPAMPFAIYLGIAQILLGMGMKAYNRIHQHGILASGDIFAHMVITSGLVAWLAQTYNGKGFMDIGQFSLGVVRLGPWLNRIPEVGVNSLLFGGLAMLLLLKAPRQFNPAIKLGGFVLGVYQYCTAIMADGLSYIRLFALGLAGGLLANAFNQIGLMFITAPDGTIKMGIGIIGTIVVLLFGHALNLFLSALGAFVHSLRLTFVEFYNNLSFRGGARAFVPFSRPADSK